MTELTIRGVAMVGFYLSAQPYHLCHAARARMQRKPYKRIDIFWEDAREFEPILEPRPIHRDQTPLHIITATLDFTRAYTLTICPSVAGYYLAKTTRTTSYL